ncbi:hypothetical protein AAFC00_004960 [Neodothiora populina]|uniref:Uncharacterized protein n=1 Tax=Neodothiora populina TaxID=2781224 RepID=A0ABR3P3X7_9PEZI
MSMPQTQDFYVPSPISPGGPSRTNDSKSPSPYNASQSAPMRQERSSISGSVKTHHFNKNDSDTQNDNDEDENMVPVTTLKHAPTFDRERTSRCCRVSNRPRPRLVEATEAQQLPLFRGDGSDEGTAIATSLSPSSSSSASAARKQRETEDAGKYVVLGIFNRVDGRPQEILVDIRDDARLFCSVYCSIIRLRGLAAFFSLKDVKYFKVFSCDPQTGVHHRIKLDATSIDALHKFQLAYSSWASWTDIFDHPSLPSFIQCLTSPFRFLSSLNHHNTSESSNEKEPKKQWWSRGRKSKHNDPDARKLNTEWAKWIHEALNGSNRDPCAALGRFPSSTTTTTTTTAAHKDNKNITDDDSEELRPHPHYSLEIILAWSPRRIAVVVFLPVLISFAVGLGLNSTDWEGTERIEMSWVVATYIATTGGIVAAMMAIVSEIKK